MRSENNFEIGSLVIANFLLKIENPEFFINFLLLKNRISRFFDTFYGYP